MKKLLFILSLAFMVSALTAQGELSPKLKKQFYQAFVNNSIPMWEDALQQLVSVHKSAQSPATLLELAVASYGLVGVCMGNQNEEKAKLYLGQSEKYAKAALKIKEDWPEAHALLGGIYGFKIAFAPMKGMWLGPKSDKHVAKAMKMDPNSIRAWYQKASSYFHTPAMFGGNVAKSVEHYAKAVSLYEAKDCLDDNWEYLDALAWLGQAYHKNGQIPEAKAIYEKALKLEPNFGWVKFALLPALSAKQEGGR